MITLDPIRRALSTHRPRRVPLGAQRAAAVLVPLFELTPGGPAHVLLTRRTETLPTHRGQVSFPGGSLDAGESVRDGALREAQEEVGLEPSRVTVLGELDDCPTFVTGFLISPVVGVVERGAFTNASEAEIAELLELPLDGFAAPGALRTEWRDVKPELIPPELREFAESFGERRDGTRVVSDGRIEPGGEVPQPIIPVHFFTVQGEVVWGATARILHSLLELLHT